MTKNEERPSILALQRVAAIIPAYNPDAVLVTLVGQLHDAGFGYIIVVDDGSHASSSRYFTELSGIPRVICLRQMVNCGKGRALKTAFNYCLTHFPGLSGVITVDADGQHSPADIVTVATEMLVRKQVVLGVRQFGAEVPLRSRVGNTMTRKVFSLLYGRVISDTQTGLRAFPLHELPDLIAIGGERYEYEAGVLASLIVRRVEICELPIQTIYIDENRSSHFNPLFDSMRIYFVFIRYFSSAALTAGIDYIGFAIALYFSNSLIASLMVGRGIALSFNFITNKDFVFRCRLRAYPVFLRYIALVALIAIISYLLIVKMQLVFGLHPLIAKIIAESILFILSFAVQRDVVFADHRMEQRADEEN